MAINLDIKEIMKYYSNPEVRKEIADYSKNRWIAIHTSLKGVSYFIRYWSKSGPPLHIASPNDVGALLARFRGLGPRTIYASVNVYHNISRREGVEDPNNIRYCTPIWDIDGSLECCGDIVDVARVIVEALEKYGVSKSVYIKWSGRGMHVQIHEKAFSHEILSRYNPLDIAYSVVDYIINACKDKIIEIINKACVGERPLKVENEIDLKRVFTVPLSLHKSLDLVAVCLKPNQLDDFTPEWAKPDNFKHDTEWRKFEEGEADELAIKAMSEIGGYFKRIGEIRKVVQVEQPKKIARRKTKKPVKIGRFQVMALLQAARYYLLTGDIDKAKSFGLNRAIFYAWAKRHAKGRVFKRKITDTTREVEVTTREGKKMMYIGDEGAFISEKGWFIIGDKEQLPSDYDKEIADKISTAIPYEEAWKAAIEYLKQFPKKVLLSQSKFYNEAYKTVRDNFFDIVVKKKRPPSLLDFENKRTE